MRLFQFERPDPVAPARVFQFEKTDLAAPTAVFQLHRPGPGSWERLFQLRTPDQGFGDTELTHRNPMNLNWVSGTYLTRSAERRNLGSSTNEPP